MDVVHKLHDPQSELLLLCNCAGVSKLYFTLRTIAPCYVSDAQVMFDNYLSNYMRNLVTGDGPGYGLLQQRVVSLPIRDGVLGIYSMFDTMQYCYLASCSQTLQLQETILQGLDIPVKGLAYQNAFDNFLQDYLLAIPADGLGQKIGPRQFSAVLSYRLGIPLFNANSSCMCCNRDMDVYGDHALHCASEVGIKFRHDIVRDTFGDISYRASVPYKIEANLGFLSHDGGDARPADIMVYIWEDGHDTCFDVTVVSPFAGGGVQAFTPGLALAKAIERKRVKYLDVCNANGYSFRTLAFTTLGELGIQSIELLRRLKSYIARHDVKVKVGNFLFIRLGLAIQKACACVLLKSSKKNGKLKVVIDVEASDEDPKAVEEEPEDMEDIEDTDLSPHLDDIDEDFAKDSRIPARVVSVEGDNLHVDVGSLLVSQVTTQVTAVPAPLLEVTAFSAPLGRSCFHYTTF
ncbi:uncharacterized protein LOC113294877 [Papaver somniferum]|uniref:uncharacterized protein LOC113294877 n=1 Tax=Papaver somniferum TaxID=3469 RepID=UPI000E6FA8AB|nr:uncharacterized protein LOC113294877 [Papaver somniferum]